MNEPRLNESTVAKLALQFIRTQMPAADVQFSSATYFTTNHDYAPLHKHWLAYFNRIEPGVLASSVGITVRIDDRTATPRFAHDEAAS